MNNQSTIIRLFIILQALFVICFAEAQDGRAVSSDFGIEKEQRILQNDTTEIGVYVDLSSYYRLNQNGDKAAKSDYYLKKALSIAQKTEHERFFLILIEKEGVKLRNKGYYRQSLFFHRVACDLLSTYREPTLLMKCFNNIGVVYRRIDEYELAIQYHLKAFHLADSVGNNHSKAISLNSIGNINFLLHDYDRAIESFEKSLELERLVHSTRGIAINLNNLGNVYLALNQNEKAHDYYKQSLDVNLRANDDKGVAICYNDLGNIYKLEKVYSEALSYFKKALELFKRISDVRYIIDTKLNIAQIFLLQGDFKKAEIYILEALPQAENLGALSQLAEINFQLSEINSMANNPIKALSYYKTSIIYKDSLLNETNQRNIEAIQTRFETENKAKEIDFLKQENQIRTLTLKRQRIILGSVILFLFLGGLGIYLAYRNKKKREKSLQEKNVIIEKAQEELSRYAKELEIAKLNAERLSNIKSDFLANMSHEIRTPLNSILGFAEILVKNPSNQSVEKYIDAIRHNSKGLLTIVNDILDLASLESGKVVIAQTPVNIASFIEDIISAFSLSAEQKRIKLLKKFNTRVPTSLMIDSIRLRQILFNLLGNALKFSDSGCITIHVSVTNPNTSNSNKVTLSITVQDQGRGISADQLEAIFESFSQGNKLDSDVTKGNGLGLSISRKLAHLMGGQLTAESILNEGSCFNLVLSDVDLGSDPDSIHDVKITKLNSALLGSCVLVVDDVSDNRLLLNELLSLEHITVIEAENGVQAISMAQTHHPELILLDIRMPGMDGYEINRKLKMDNDTRHIPVVAVSASVFDSDRIRFSEAGFADFLSKPLQINDLIEVLNHCIRKPEKL